jgi:hypothetical protein
MSMITLRTRPIHKPAASAQERRGVFLVLVVISLVAAMTFVGFSVDLGLMTLTKTRMQASADAAALAAAQEIVVAIRSASQQAGSGINMSTVHAQAATDARDMAQQVAQINGHYIDPNSDVILGRRMLAADGVTWTDTWGTAPFNMVRVNIRKDNPDASAPDARLPLIFASAAGATARSIVASATAFIESRDIVCVLDYSSSMNDDSCLHNETVSRLGKPAVEANLDAIWDALVAADVRYSNSSSEKKFPSGGWGLLNSKAGTYQSSDDSLTVLDNLNIYQPEVRYYYSWTLVTSGDDYYKTTSGGYEWRRYIEGAYSGQLRRKRTSGGSWSTVAETTAPGYFPTIPESCLPWPQEGKSTATGLRWGKPSLSTSKSRWIAYVDYMRTSSTMSAQGYSKIYGYRTLLHYLMNSRPSNYQSEDLWRVEHYPFHAMKEGMTTFCDFMTELSYGDNVGLVNYSVEARIEGGLWEDGAGTTVDLNGDEMTIEYDDIDTIQRHKQAGHYSSNTAIGAGLEKGLELIDEEGRYGAQQCILLMTDGLANVAPSDFVLPGDWDWNRFDYDGNGSADYTTSSQAAQYALYQASLAADQDITVHTIAVGAGADADLMKAISHMSGGLSIIVPAGSSTEAMEAQLRDAFSVIAGQVPPARLVDTGN